jgi:hypothetical protein
MKKYGLKYCLISLLVLFPSSSVLFARMSLLWPAESSGGFVCQLATLHYVYILQNNWKTNFGAFNIENFMTDYFLSPQNFWGDEWNGIFIIWRIQVALFSLSFCFSSACLTIIFGHVKKKTLNYYYWYFSYVADLKIYCVTKRMHHCR